MASDDADSQMDWTDDDGSNASDDGLDPDGMPYLVGDDHDGWFDDNGFDEYDEADGDGGIGIDLGDINSEGADFFDMLAHYSTVMHHNHGHGHHHDHDHDHDPFITGGDEDDDEDDDDNNYLTVDLSHGHPDTMAEYSIGLTGVHFAHRFPTPDETITNVLLAAGNAQPTPLHTSANEGWEPPLFPRGEPSDDDNEYDWDPSPAQCVLELGMEERDLGRLPLHVNVLYRRSRQRVPIIETRLSMAEVSRDDDGIDDADKDRNETENDYGDFEPLLHIFPPNKRTLIYRFDRFRAAVKRITDLSIERDTVMVTSLHFEKSIERGRMCEIAWYGVMVSLELTVHAMQQKAAARGEGGPAAMVVDIII